MSERYRPREETSLIGVTLFGAALVIFGLIGITVLFGSWYTIAQNERGVITRNGRVVGTAEPGLGFKTPWVDGVRYISVKTRLLTWDKVPAYSLDQQPADLHFSLNYQILPTAVQAVYVNYGDEDTLVSALITPRVVEQVKNILGSYTASDSVKKRGELNTKIEHAIIADVESATAKPIVKISGFQLQNIDFSDAYEKAVENRMQAEVEVAKAQQDAYRAKMEAEKAYNEADGRARSVEREADAKAHAIEVQGRAEATAIRAKGDALKDNPGLPVLIQAEKWNGALPTTMLPSTGVPMLTLQQK